MLTGTRSLLPVITLHGRGYDVGFQHGSSRRRQIRAFLDDGLARLNRLLHTPISLQSLAPTLEQYRSEIARQLPAMIEELRGLADGAQISADEVLLLQLRRELVGYSRRSARGDCTLFGHLSPVGHSLLAQTVDLNGDLAEQSYILRIADTGNDGRSVLLFTFTGLLGYLGINSHGLAIGLNLVMGGTWKPGVPAYMAIRHLLDTATCVEDCAELLAQIGLASSRAFTFCDGKTLANVEILDNQLHWSYDRQLAHTNHFLAPAFVPADEINVFARNGSIARLQSCLAALPQLHERIDADACFEILDRSPICVPPDGDIRREATVARVVMMPRTQLMIVKKGADPHAYAQTISVNEAS